MPLINVRGIDDRRLNRNIHQDQQSQDRRHSEGSVSQLEGQERPNRLGHDDAKHDDDRKLEIAVGSKKGL
jgi:hypothetical protein